MKRIIAMLLSLALLLGCAASVAEEKETIGTISINGAFTLKGVLPEGYKLHPVVVEQDQVIARISSDDPTRPVLMLSVAFDETYSDVFRMNDLDDEALTLLENTFIAVDPTVELSYGETALGTRLLIARKTGTSADYVDFLSIYEGYFIEFVMTASREAEDRTISDEQVQMCVDFLTEMDFVPGIAAEESTLNLAGQKYDAAITDFNAEERTIDVELKKAMTFDRAFVDAIQVGDTIRLGDDEILVDEIEDIDETRYINGEYSFYTGESGETWAYDYDGVYLETVAKMTLAVADDVVFEDGIDPETLEMLWEEPIIRTADEFFEMLVNPAEWDPSFAIDNVYLYFGAEGQLTRIERFYVPWQ